MFVVVVDDLFRVVHAAVTDLDGVAIEDFSLETTSLEKSSIASPSRSVYIYRDYFMESARVLFLFTS